MPKAGELKRGMIIDFDGVPHAVKTIDCKSPSSRGASTIYKIRFTNLKTLQKRDESLKSDDMLTEADCQRVKVQYSYQDGDEYIFMNNSDYSQYSLNAEDIADSVGFLSVGLEDITALLMDGEVLTIELPTTVSMKIIDTPPKIKGASASSRTKTAILETGLEIQVPEYLDTDEVIKVNTSTGKFMSRD